jgi:putative CocE/NonD family hydrolase
MYGFSYQGMTQLLAAAEQPPGLVCIAPGMTAHDLYHGWFYHQGALRLSTTLGWGLQMLRADARRRNLEEASDRLEAAWSNVRTQPLFAPYEMLPALRSNGLPTYVRDWLTHSEPSEYWSKLDVSQCVSAIGVPALHLSGWYDSYLDGSVNGFLALSRCAKTEFAREHQYLVAGPWIHIPWGDMAGEAEFGSESLIDTDDLLLRWFNHWLKDSGEFQSEPKVRHFALGANTWFATETWSTENQVTLYLHSDGRANSRKGDGRIDSKVPQADGPRDVFVYDPEVPVHAPGGPQALSGSFNQASLELGNNLLVYTTTPLTEELHIFGHPTVTLYAATSASSADLTAKLVRVRSDGRADFLCIGIARSNWLFRHSEYKADQIHCWEFSLEPTSCVLFAGEQLRLEIASSAFPLYDRNPSTSTPPNRADNWNWQRSTQQILHDANHPSALHLPVLESQA